MSMPFRLTSQGYLVGHGLTFRPDEQIAPGVIALDAALLDRLYELALLEARSLPDPAAKRRARVRGAMEDLVEDLGLDPSVLDEAPDR